MNTLNLHGKLLTLDHPIVMGIINITPDSFYTSCQTGTEQEVLQCAEKALTEGATILDIGGYSSRPNADNVSEDEEWRRVSQACHWIRTAFPEAILSVDTFRSSIARKAVEEYDVQMINDISGGEMDREMFTTIASLQVPYILMHMRGTPQTMQQQTAYTDMMAEIITYFEQKVYALHRLGVKDIILDPGFGFAKTVEQNYELLRKMPYLQTLSLPILAGLSHKSMIYKALHITPQEALNGTTALNMLALQNGASILRVHEVKEAIETIRLWEMYNKS